MADLVRFGVSVEQDLSDKFDHLITERGYSNRSEALRDLMREALIQAKIAADEDTEALGSLTLIYDHHAGGLIAEIGDIQHDHHASIISVMHLHINHDDCLEIIALRGKAANLTTLANQLLSLKGIKNGKLYLTLASSQITS